MPNFLPDNATFTDADLGILDKSNGELADLHGEHYELHYRAAEAISYLRDRTPSVGAAKSSGGTRYLGLPDARLSTIATRAQTADQSRYYRFRSSYAFTLDQFAFEVTTGPSSDGNVKLALFAADEDWQPTGAALAAATVDVATSFTGVKTADVGPVALQPGRYVVRSNASQAMTLRSSAYGVDSNMAPTIGSTGLSEFMLVTETNSAVSTSTPLAWTGVGAASNGAATPIFLRWVDPFA